MKSESDPGLTSSTLTIHEILSKVLKASVEITLNMDN